MGVAFDWQRRFSVILVCGRRQSHRLGGKPSATPARTQEVDFEVSYSYFYCVSAMAPGGNKFQFTIVPDMTFHWVRYFVVHDMFFWSYACLFKL